MRAGTMRDRVTIQRPGTTSTPGWGATSGWTDIATVWASVVPVKADESFDQKGVASATNYTVKMRYRDVTNGDRIQYRGKTLDIVAIIDTAGRRRELEIQAVAHG